MNGKSSVRISTFAIVILTASGLLLFCGGLEAQSLQKIRVGSTTASITTLPSDIAAKMGFFKDVGLDLEMITIRSADIINDSFLKREVKLGCAKPQRKFSERRLKPWLTFEI